MKKLGLILVLLLIPYLTFASDFDRDGIDDVASIEQQENGSWNWTWIKSSDGTTGTLNGFGQDGSFPCVGEYDGAAGIEPCHIDTQYFWNIRLSDETVDAEHNFGRLNPSYMPGHDFDGDGDSDTAKMPSQCSKAKQSCYRKRVRVNGALNTRESESGGNNEGLDKPFQGSVPTFTGLFGSRFSCIGGFDIDGDSDHDICVMDKRGKNPKIMTLKCKDARALTKTANVRLGKVFNCPLRLVTSDDADSVVVWRASTKTGITSIRIVAPDGTKTTAEINAVGKVITADWLDDMSSTQQIGVVADGIITIYNPVDESISTATAPGSGFIVDTDDSVFGKRAQRVTQTKEPRRLNSKNVCKLFYCTGPMKGQRK